MTSYLNKNYKLFNESQTEVLKSVINAKASSVTLVQGPPGTGKTHTMTGVEGDAIEEGIMPRAFNQIF